MEDYNCPRCMRDSEINFANLHPLNQQDNEDLLKLIKQIQVFILINICTHFEFFLPFIFIFSLIKVRGLSWSQLILMKLPIITMWSKNQWVCGLSNLYFYNYLN
jgi:hypothetical protein